MSLTTARIYSIKHDIGQEWPAWGWGWQCPCGDEDQEWGSATEAQESLDQHAAFCIES